MWLVARGLSSSPHGASYKAAHNKAASPVMRERSQDGSCYLFITRAQEWCAVTPTTCSWLLVMQTKLGQCGKELHQQTGSAEGQLGGCLSHGLSMGGLQAFKITCSAVTNTLGHTAWGMCASLLVLQVELLQSLHFKWGNWNWREVTSPRSYH